MPKKVDLSDRYARGGGSRRVRRRNFKAPLEDAAPEALTDSAEAADRPTPTVAPRVFARSRPAPVVSYHYIRADLIRIAVVISLLLVVMAVLFVILR